MREVRYLPSIHESSSKALLPAALKRTVVLDQIWTTATQPTAANDNKWQYKGRGDTLHQVTHAVVVSCG